MMVAQHPIGRHGNPEDIAGGVLFTPVPEFGNVAVCDEGVTHVTGIDLRDRKECLATNNFRNCIPAPKMLNVEILCSLLPCKDSTA